MRPLRLEVTGFASFRETTVVDFSDAELFVITGPTGSGKSSLIDAMVFALYGAIPRYDDSRMLYPIITTGTSEARVRFDFAVGEDEYTAVRITRRTKIGGATTREARLERKRAEGEPATLAGDANGLTKEIEKLLGLGFDHFLKCIALPQGDFAEFLRAKPSDRQTLLVQLLDLHVYRAMAKAANLRAKNHEQLAEFIESELAGDLALATPQRLKEAQTRVKELKKLQKMMASAEPKIAKLRKQLETDQNSRDEARKNAKVLGALRTPKQVGELAASEQQVHTLLEDTETARKAAETELEAAEAARAKLPDPSEPKLGLQKHQAKDVADRQLEELTPKVKKAAQTLTGATTAHSRAAKAAEEAQAALEAARRAHAAAHLMQGLKVGDTCPVCAQKITKLAKPAKPEELAKAEAALEEARSLVETTHREQQQRWRESTKLQGQLETAQKASAAADEALRDQPAAAELQKTLKKIDAASAAVETARTKVRQAKARVADAERARKTLAEALAAAWKALDKTRDDCAALQPPPVDRERLGEAWKTLTQWAQTRAPQEAARAETLDATIETQEAAIASEVETLLQACRDLDLEVNETNYTTHVATEVGRTESRVTAIKAQIAKAADQRAKQKELRAQAKVEGELGRLLGKGGLEAWLLERAFARLCASASHILRDLSSGQYSIRLNEGRDFEVIDHHNADEPRLARTLSGGETFMASLALALALAEDVAQLAAGGAARLDSLFLDEGFGTLDPDTLDTVATAIEALGARGRVVGLITHVRELAERVPVRFQVSKDARTSSVERVAA